MDHESIKEFLKRIRSFTEVYIEHFSNFDSDSLFSFSDYKTRLLHICHTLDVATFYPYILQLLYLNEVKKELSDNDLKNLFKQMERYIILKAVCNGSTKNYNNECVQLIKGKRTPDDLCKGSSDISRRAFDDGIINLRQNKIPTVLLFWVELFNRENQYSDIKDLKYVYTLEHIMPQKWQTNWSVKDVPVIDEKGNTVEDEKEAAEIRAAAVYEIGNMTLLNSKLNTAVSNGTFYTKVNGDGKKYKHCMKDLADLYLTRSVLFWAGSKYDFRYLEPAELSNFVYAGMVIAYCGSKYEIPEFKDIEYMRIPVTGKLRSFQEKCSKYLPIRFEGNEIDFPTVCLTLRYLRNKTKGHGYIQPFSASELWELTMYYTIALIRFLKLAEFGMYFSDGVFYAGYSGNEYVYKVDQFFMFDQNMPCPLMDIADGKEYFLNFFTGAKLEREAEQDIVQ